MGFLENDCSARKSLPHGKDLRAVAHSFCVDAELTGRDEEELQGAAMLQVDLNEGRYEIVRFITKSCSAFGEVRSISIFLESSPIAVIEMSTMEQTEELALKLEGKLVGANAFIDLAQRPH